MPVPLGQLPSSADFGVVTTSASLSAVCVVTYVVVGPVVIAKAVTPIEPSRNWCRVTDPKERELMMLQFGKSTLLPGPSSAPQLYLITPLMVVPVPILSAVPAAVVVPSAAALSASSCGPAPVGRPDPVQLLLSQPSRPRLPGVPRPVPRPGPITSPWTVPVHRTRLPAVPGHGPVTCLRAAPAHGTRLPPASVRRPCLPPASARWPRLPTACGHEPYCLPTQLLHHSRAPHASVELLRAYSRSSLLARGTIICFIPSVYFSDFFYVNNRLFF